MRLARGQVRFPHLVHDLVEDDGLEGTAHHLQHRPHQIENGGSQLVRQIECLTGKRTIDRESLSEGEVRGNSIFDVQVVPTSSPEWMTGRSPRTT